MRVVNYNDPIENFIKKLNEAGNQNLSIWLQHQLMYERFARQKDLQRELTDKEIDRIVEKVLQRLSVRADTKEAVKEINKLNKAINDLTNLGGKK